ncbi:MAG: YhbY family RNA-binding protein [archaeon]
MPAIAQIQLGKNGVTNNFISTLKDHFNKSRTVKISVLRSATRDKKQLKQMTQDILEKLGSNFTTRIIGFTIVVKRWRKKRK